jgi:3-oxoacyl-[acyl-carrier protein] reductase
MDLGIAGCRAAVAAASGGLGFAVARALAEEGVRVALCAREGSRVRAAAEKIGRGAVGIACDVGSAEGARGFVAAAREALGGVDILVANGGGPPAGPAHATELGALREALEHNLLAMVAMIQQALPEMRARRFGRVLAITSIGVREPLANMALSNAARTGLTGFLKTLAREVAPDGVTVNSLLPGAHDTERVRSLAGPSMDAFVARIPVGRIGEPADFGRIAAFLCSRWTPHLTGAAIPVAGGADSALW